MVEQIGGWVWWFCICKVTTLAPLKSYRHDKSPRACVHDVMRGLTSQDNMGVLRNGKPWVSPMGRLQVNLYIFILVRPRVRDTPPPRTSASNTALDFISVGLSVWLKNNPSGVPLRGITGSPERNPYAGKRRGCDRGLPGRT